MLKLNTLTRGPLTLSQKIVIVSVLLAVIGSALLLKASYIELKATMAQYLLQQSWHKTLIDSRKKTPDNAVIQRPWPWADFHAVARLSVPRLGVKQFVLSDSSGRTLAFGPGHVQASILPGRTGQSVISGHRDTHFQFLKQLQVGDGFTLQWQDGQLYAFEVFAKKVVAHDYQLPLEGSSPVLVLVTCYPFEQRSRDADQRLLVFAKVKKARALAKSREQVTSDSWYL